MGWLFGIGEDFEVGEAFLFAEGAFGVVFFADERTVLDGADSVVENVVEAERGEDGEIVVSVEADAEAGDGSGYRCSGLFDLGAAPFDDGEAGAFGGGEDLFWDCDGVGEGFEFHHDADGGVRGRGDGEGHVGGDFFWCGEVDVVVGVVFEVREPVDDEFVSFAVGEAEEGEFLFEETGGF